MKALRYFPISAVYFVWSVSVFVESQQPDVCQRCHDTEAKEINWTEGQTLECQYPCHCQPPPLCPSSVPLIRDGCGCCWHCAKQENSSCDTATLCDSSKNLACLYKDSRDTFGICKVLNSVTCEVNNKTYKDGETFLLDCRTQCMCKSGTYACVSLCPGESMLPGHECRNARLVAVDAAECCREWQCDHVQDPKEKSCSTKAGRWSDCSAPHCGLGISNRWYLQEEICKVEVQNRLCQLRPCNRLTAQEEELVKEIVQGSKQHHMRRSHTCKATLRYQSPVYLKVGSCVSTKTYRPRMCSDCLAYPKNTRDNPSTRHRRPQNKGKCCTVHSSTTVDVTFMCPLHAVPDLLRNHNKKWSINDLMKAKETDQNFLKSETKQHENEFGGALPTRRSYGGSEIDEKRSELPTNQGQGTKRNYGESELDGERNELMKNQVQETKSELEGKRNEIVTNRATTERPMKLIDILLTMDEGQPVYHEQNRIGYQENKLDHKSQSNNQGFEHFNNNYQNKQFKFNPDNNKIQGHKEVTGLHRNGLNQDTHEEKFNQDYTKVRYLEEGNKINQDPTTEHSRFYKNTEASTDTMNLDNFEELDHLITQQKLLKPLAEYGILAEDFTTTDIREFFMVKSDNHEEITHKVQWIIRCTCTQECNDPT